MKTKYCAVFLFCLCTLSIVANDNQVNNKDTISTNGALPGKFTINAKGKQIRFAKGNLRYTQSTDVWWFAEHQYDILVEKNITKAKLITENNLKYGESRYFIGESLADTIDLFLRSGADHTNFGVSISNSDTVCSGDFVDWGTNPIVNGGNEANQWRTLTYEELHFLLNERPNHNKLIGIASVNGKNGLVLLPDNWELPAGLSFNCGFYEYEQRGCFVLPQPCINFIAAYSKQQYSVEDWIKMEEAGAVFLPISAKRNGNKVYSYASYCDHFGYTLDYKGYYWLVSTECTYYLLYFDSTYASEIFSGVFSFTLPCQRTYNYSYPVRLVQDVE